MLKRGSVIQAKQGAERPFRSGNTYRIHDIDEGSFTVKWYNQFSQPQFNTYSQSQFHSMFTLIPEDLCPACLSNKKRTNAEWCDECYRDS